MPSANASSPAEIRDTTPSHQDVTDCRGGSGNCVDSTGSYNLGKYFKINEARLN